MPGAKHVHKYQKMQMNDVKVWSCANCFHYMPKHIEQLVKLSICWNCNKEFSLDYKSKEDKPICSSCRESKNAS